MVKSSSDRRRQPCDTSNSLDTGARRARFLTLLADGAILLDCETLELAVTQILDELKTFPKYTQWTSRKSNPQKDSIWRDPTAELAFLKALIIWRSKGRKKIKFKDNLYGRNELVAMYVSKMCDIECSKKQISSHMQVLRGFDIDGLASHILFSSFSPPGADEEQNYPLSASLLDSIEQLDTTQSFGQLKEEKPYYTEPPIQATIAPSIFGIFLTSPGRKRKVRHTFTSLSKVAERPEIEFSELVANKANKFPMLAEDQSYFENSSVVLCTSGFYIPSSLEGLEQDTKFTLSQEFKLRQGVEFERIYANTYIYENGMPVDEILHEKLKIVSETGAVVGTKFGFDYWANRAPELVSRPLTVGNISVQQEVWSVVGNSPTLESVFLWEFHESQKGRTFWRKVKRIPDGRDDDTYMADLPEPEPRKMEQENEAIEPKLTFNLDNFHGGTFSKPFLWPGAVTFSPFAPQLHDEVSFGAAAGSYDSFWSTLLGERSPSRVTSPFLLPPASHTSDGLAYQQGQPLPSMLEPGQDSGSSNQPKLASDRPDGEPGLETVNPKSVMLRPPTLMDGYPMLAGSFGALPAVGPGMPAANGQFGDFGADSKVLMEW